MALVAGRAGGEGEGARTEGRRWRLTAMDFTAVDMADHTRPNS